MSLHTWGKWHWKNTVLEKHNFIPKLPTLCAQIIARCITSTQNNASQGPKASPGIQSTGIITFEDLEVDFTEVKPCQGYQYLLVLVCTYSGWVEAYPPPHIEKAREIQKALLREIIHRYRLPFSIRSDNRPAFLVEIVQGLAKILRIKWKLHRAYRPQNSGKVEHMNQTLKITLAKLCQETQSP
jgi:hypothetical protein